MAISDLLNITLRRATSDDGESFERWHNQPSYALFKASPKRDLDQLRAMLVEQEDLRLDSKAIGRFYWICELEGFPVAQVQVAIDERDRKQNSATLGYIVDEDFHSRGIATATVRAVVPLAFDPGDYRSSDSKAWRRSVTPPPGAYWRRRGSSLRGSSADS